MKFFKTYSLMRLRNQEFPAAYGSICSVVENKEFTVEYLTKAIECVNSHNSKLVILKNMNYKHPNTAKIDELKVKRHDAFLSLKGKAKYGLRSPIDSEREASELLNTWFMRHRKHLVRPSIHEQSSVAKEMNDDIVNNTDIQEALSELGVIDTFDSIQLFTNKIDRLFSMRNKDLQEVTRVAYRLKKDAYGDLLMLLNSIEMAIVFEDGDKTVLMGYVKEINGIMQTFKAKYERRTTRSRNANEETDNNLPEPSVDDETNDGSEESVDTFNSDTGINDASSTMSEPETTNLFNDASKNGTSNKSSINGNSLQTIPTRKDNSAEDHFSDQ